MSTKRVEEIWKGNEDLASTLGQLDEELGEAMKWMMGAQKRFSALECPDGVGLVDMAADAVTTVRLVLALLKWEREDESTRRKVISVRTI